jgi:hypothetical protein
MELKALISKALEEKNASFSMLAEAIGITEEELFDSIDEKNVQVRVIELISKELQIPLYSLFRNPKEFYSSEMFKKYYTEDADKYRVIELLNEIERLKSRISELEQNPDQRGACQE